MSPALTVFLEFALTRNLAFVLFFGALLPIGSGLHVRRSFSSGLKHAVVVAFSGTVGAAIVSLLPPAMGLASPVVVFTVAIAAAATLRGWGELTGEWAGMPRMILAFGPTVGLQLYLVAEKLSGFDAVLASLGAGLGYYLAIVFVAVTVEQLRLAEAPQYAKRTGALLFAMAVFALALSGFQFY